MVISILVGCSGQDFEEPLNYIENNSIYDISFDKLYKYLSIKYKLDNNLKLQDFTLGLNNKHKINVMYLNLIENNHQQNSSIWVVYNRRNDIFYVKKFRDKHTLKQGLDPQKFFSKLDGLKNILQLPQGDYEEFVINLISPDVIKLENTRNHLTYVVYSNKIYKTNSDIEGVCLFTYKVPVKKGDTPVYYVIKNYFDD